MQPRLPLLIVAAMILAAPTTAQLDAGAAITVDQTSVDASINSELDGNDTWANASIDVPGPELAVGSDGDMAAAMDLPSNGSFGRFHLSSDRAEGGHVDLRVASQGIQDYRVGHDTFFAAVDVGALSAHASGPHLKASFAGGHLQATDAASAGLRVDATESSNATVRLDPGATAVQASDRLVWIEAGGRSGSLAILGNGSMTLDGPALAIHLGPGSILRFEAHTGDETAWQEEQRAFASGRLGAELDIAGHEARTSQADEYTVQVSNIRSGDRSVAFTVDSDSPHARVVTVALDASLLSSGAQMRFDGQPAQRSGTASEVYAAADASMAMYSLIEADGVLQAVVHIPGFSAHDIEFGPAYTGPPAAGEDAPGAGFVSLGAVVGLVALLRRR